MLGFLWRTKLGIYNNVLEVVLLITMKKQKYLHILHKEAIMNT